ncbi:calcium-activated chloride channel regulator 1-like [Bradysia coprophila]|uniref:calcium-activated chloride channel regulator 1-like n=1 Tax=Bradysia coprophila TaxID=38358 RepID=UPI00187D7C37|nr:calcium-activated chloride channel regulator 1-like [Bradysia coprophila]
MWYIAFIVFLWAGVDSVERNAPLEYSLLEQQHNVKYLTYSKEDPKNPTDIRDVRFDDNNQTTVFIIHGYSTNSLDGPVNLVEDIFQHNPTVSRVVVVSWIDYACAIPTVAGECNSVGSGYYQVATLHVPTMAADLNEKLMYVRRKGAGTVELIGHCIGAHVAGQAGKLFKRFTGTNIDKIIGLDPAGLYWSTHLNEALQMGIANDLLVFHTNMAKYGFPARISPYDKLVNGGQTQPSCKNKLTEDICSHNEAWQMYSKYVKNGSVPSNEIPATQPYVLCVDISESMRNNNRLTIAVDASKQLISNMVTGTHVGVVTFNHNAVAVHDIVQIEGSAERNSLTSPLPKVAKGSTSIGAGLRMSMELIKKLIPDDNGELCSTIVLISDGEQTSGEGPYDVLPEIQNSCITINSIGLGADASQDLENISAETAGQVYYVIEGGSDAQMADTIRAVTASYESELDADDRPIHFPTSEIELADGDVDVPFEIEDNIGKDTEIDLISDDIDDIDMTLTSPSGQEYTPESPEFSSSLMRKFYNIGLLEPGHYNLTVNKSGKSRRSVRSATKAILMIKSNEVDKRNPVVRLDASVSSRVLKYPKKLNIFAEVRVDKYPIIHADVYADIKGLNQEIIRLKLSDNGVSPDRLANDGVYTASIIKLPKVERYSVTVVATSNGTAEIVMREVNYFLRQNSECRWPVCRRQRVRPFRRETDVGSIKLFSKDGEEEIPPSPILDLRAMVPYDDQQIVILEWSCPAGNMIFNMGIKHYDIRVLIGDEPFENAYQLNESHIVNLTSVGNCTDGGIERFSVNIPENIWTMRKENPANNSYELRFALKAVGLSDARSDRSNEAVAVFKKPRAYINQQCRTVYRRTRIGIFQIEIC